MYLCVRAQMHPYTISEHCLITASLLHENLLANSLHTQFGECEKLVREQRNLSQSLTPALQLVHKTEEQILEINLNAEFNLVLWILQRV